MPLLSENKYLNSFLEHLITSYETEINYNPIEIKLDSTQISDKDIPILSQFITEPRKRLFIFKIPGNELASSQLALLARRTTLNNTAEKILKNTSREPKINPLKQALIENPDSIRSGIQIQKNFIIPQAPTELKKKKKEHRESTVPSDLNLIAMELPNFPEFSKQLKALGINYLHDEAAQNIKKYPHVFKDGIIPKNLPTGFYIDQDKKAFCYTSNPDKLPSALAPVLNQLEPLALPSLEQINALSTSLSKDSIHLLMDKNYSVAQKNALIQTMSVHSEDVKSFFALFKSIDTKGLTLVIKPDDLQFIVPLLSKQLLLGGEAHTALLSRLLTLCVNKKVRLDFLKNPEVEQALLSTRGIKNLEKLTQLPAEQKEWWNSLVTAHLKYDKNSFDFNTFFEAYVQVFLPRITEKNLTLPNPCPVEHNGHLLITLNRILDVIEQAENPQEQCLSLSHLNWGPTGVHYAVVQKPEPENFKQVASCMKIEGPEDTITAPHLIYEQLDNESFQLKPWLFRYMGQHWKAEIRLSNIQAQLLEIEKLTHWTPVQRNQLTFILACTYSNKTTLSLDQWQKSLNECISMLGSVTLSVRADLLNALSACFKFIPPPSLSQINKLLELCLQFKQSFPTKNLKEEFITPLVSCLENEGFEQLETLEERIRKITEGTENIPLSLTIIASFTALLQKNRPALSPHFIQLLTKLNDSHLTQTKIDNLMGAFKSLGDTKGEHFKNITLSSLSQINIAKSQPLPTLEQIQTLLRTLTHLPDSIPTEINTMERQENWLIKLISDNHFLPGCALGKGDISKLDDLIVEALVDAIKKRSAAFRIDKLKEKLLEKLQNKILVPEGLREQLNRELIPLFDAVHDLVQLLQSPQPQFSAVIEKLRYFEECKPILLNGVYGLLGLGTTKGEYILSYLLTGAKAPEDTTTSWRFAVILKPLFNVFKSEIQSFFDNPQNKQIVKDLDFNTSLSWMAKFNETHSLIFFFTEELIQKKVLPALKKTLQQLNIQDPEFEKSILDEASIITESGPSDQALQGYKNKIEGIANYLNLLIDIKDKFPSDFNKIYKHLNTGPFARLNYNQKQILLTRLIKDKASELDHYLKLTAQALEDHPEANSTAIERAMNGIAALFNLTDLEPETQLLFFKMSMAHNLKSTILFPLAELNALKKSDLPEQTKSLIIKHIIQILSRLSGTDSPELVQHLVQQTQLFLTQNQQQANLCIALLKRVSLENPNQDLGAYSLLLQQLSTINPGNREKIATILRGLANNKKDDTLNLPALLEISKGFGRRSTEDINLVLQLFETAPYPDTQSLNSALLAHDSEKLQAYCSNFDTNPFARDNQKRKLSEQFATNRIKDALISLENLLEGVALPHSLQIKLAEQLTFIETLGYTDPLNPNDFQELKKLTATSRRNLQDRAVALLQGLRSKSIPEDQLEITQLELLAHLREIYIRTTSLFPNSTQMLVCLLALIDPSSNLLMRIKTGEGKSIIAPILSVIQWFQGGTVVQWTDNPALLYRDYTNNCEPFFDFLKIKHALIQSDSPPETYQVNGINCSTVENMSGFYLTLKENKKEALIQNGEPIHFILDECHGALLDQTLLNKLVAELFTEEENKDNSSQWIYPLAYQFINLPAFRNTDPKQGKVWDEEEDLEQFRLFLNKEINEKFNGDAEKQNRLLGTSNTQLMLWIRASCIAATRVENKHFIVQPIKEKDETGQEVTKKMVCVPLIKSIPKPGAIFTDEVQQALQARLQAERPDQAHYFSIDHNPPVLASLSALGLVKLFQKTKGRLIGISATPGDKPELEELATTLGTQAIGIAPHAGDHRIMHEPIFTFSDEETLQAIHNAIESRKTPVTKPTLAIDPNIAIQTHEEREALIAKTRKAIKKWSRTQTQPILIINEDFDISQKIGARLEAYKAQGFKVPIITGKESPKELEGMIRQLGQVNTTAVGTAMLSIGTDIDTADHPKGLLVIQTYPDTVRKTTQIAGRAARNGQPGEWLPIYQIKPPQHWLAKLLYYIFPWYRKSINEHTIATLKKEIQAQATVDRLFTQAIDEVQQILMQQIEAWESLLLELYPNDLKIQLELYQWRQTFLGELTRSQDARIAQETLKTSISQFKSSACKLWESLREEQWINKAQNAPHKTEEQTLRYNYLKHLDLQQEFHVQSALQKKSHSFLAGPQALIHQNIDTVIRDKAGVILKYTNPTDPIIRKDLKLAQCKQLLPQLIAEFCSVSPEAIKTLVPVQTSKRSFLPDIINSFIYKIIEHKNKILYPEEQQEITQNIIKLYEKELLNADSNQIIALLEKIKPLLLNYSANLKSFSLKNQFKMQGLILTFCTLYENSDLAAEPQLQALKVSHDEEIMKRMALHLVEKFAWVKEIPEPLHAFFERGIAKEAANAIYDLAVELIKAPQDKNKIQALYAGLEQQQLILKNKYLFSLGHSNPKKVITDAIHAIESLNHAPHCDREFRDNCHDHIVSTHLLDQFCDHLSITTPYFLATNDPVWQYLKKTLFRISYQPQNSQGHVILELYEAVKRFSTYEAYKPYLSQLHSLKSQLRHSLNELKKKDGLRHNMEESLFARKKEQFATLFNIDPDKISLQSETDGIESYIQLQIEDAPLKEGFTGYQSSFFTRIETERSRLNERKIIFEANKKAVRELSDVKVTQVLPEGRRAGFEKLLKLKSLLAQDWEKELDFLPLSELPEPIQNQLKFINELKQLDWKKQPVDVGLMNKNAALSSDTAFTNLLKEQSILLKALEEIRIRVSDAEKEVQDQQEKIIKEEEIIETKRTRIQQLSWYNPLEYSTLSAQILYHQSLILYYKNQLKKPNQALNTIKSEETECLQKLQDHNQLLENKRLEFISQLKVEIKQAFVAQLDENGREQVKETRKEFQATENTINKIQMTELQKSRYQSRRFFKSRELLTFEARLSLEEELIPSKTPLKKTLDSSSPISKNHQEFVDNHSLNYPSPLR